MRQERVPSSRGHAHTGGRVTLLCDGTQHSTEVVISQLKIKLEKEERYILAFEELTVWQRGTR